MSMVLPFLNFGIQKDGDYSSVGSATDSPTKATCAATAGTKTVSATISVVPGDMIFLHQTQGANAGKMERNYVKSYTPGTITTVFPIQNTYSSTGSFTVAQVLKVPQYRNFLQNTSHILTRNSWNLSNGGIIVKCAQTMTINGSIRNNGGAGSEGGFKAGQGTGGGFYGGYSNAQNDNDSAWEGEGINGHNFSLGSGRDASANLANGGGAGQLLSNTPAGGAGGGNGAAGQNGQVGLNPGDAGIASGDVSTEGVELTFGGGGGGGIRNSDFNGAGGGSGGGLIVLIAELITITGDVQAKGGNGGNSSTSNGDGGGGAGGSILLVSNRLVLGTNKALATGGTGGSTGGGNGGTGRIAAIYGSTLSGVTTPTITTFKNQNLIPQGGASLFAMA